MSDIKRYDPILGPYDDPEMEEWAKGGYVTYKDHLEAVQAEVAEAEQRMLERCIEKQCPDYCGQRDTNYCQGVHVDGEGVYYHDYYYEQGIGDEVPCKAGPLHDLKQE